MAEHLKLSANYIYSTFHMQIIHAYYFMKFSLLTKYTYPLLYTEVPINKLQSLSLSLPHLVSQHPSDSANCCWVYGRLERDVKPRSSPSTMLCCYYL